MDDRGHPPLTGLDEDHTLLIRTDFTDDAGWVDALTRATARTEDGMVAALRPVDDSRYDGMTPEDAAELASHGDTVALLLADDETVTDEDERTLCVVCADGFDESFGRTFRVVPEEAWSVETNLRLANMEFAEFADTADAGD
ncbi:MAG TPA: hypothetical protein VE503_00160, partial [Ornithinibacter sp.]|nr:hypothetical protein [Ornithinibacter sp.]